MNYELCIMNYALFHPCRCLRLWFDVERCGVRYSVRLFAREQGFFVGAAACQRCVVRLCHQVQRGVYLAHEVHCGVRVFFAPCPRRRRRDSLRCYHHAECGFGSFCALHQRLVCGVGKIYQRAGIFHCRRFAVQLPPIPVHIFEFLYCREPLNYVFNNLSYCLHCLFCLLLRRSTPHC